MIIGFQSKERGSLYVWLLVRVRVSGDTCASCRIAHGTPGFIVPMIDSNGHSKLCDARLCSQNHSRARTLFGSSPLLTLEVIMTRHAETSSPTASRRYMRTGMSTSVIAS